MKFNLCQNKISLKKVIIYAISAIVIFAVGYKSGQYNSSKLLLENTSVIDENYKQRDINKSQTSHLNDSFSENVNFDSFDTSNLNNLMCNGTYRCCSDFAPGDYYILSLFGAESRYAVSDSLNDIKHDKDVILRKIHAEDGQYIKLGYALLIPEHMIDIDNWSKYGVFAVGTDLKPGEYKIEKTTDEYCSAAYSVNIQGTTLTAYQIFNGPPENADTTECSVLFNNQEYITLKEGQYVAINNASLTYVTN